MWGAWQWYNAPGAGRGHGNVTVREQPEAVETQSGDISQVIPQQAIADLPLNGRRFTDLALLTPGVTQDPRGLTSDSNGDLSFGGIRGFQNNFLVDGTDNNNSFFAQARGRYRAPYQFSNEVIKEFRVSSNPTAPNWAGGRRGVQRGHQVRDQRLAWQRLLLCARPRFRRPAAVCHQQTRRSPAAVWRHLRRTHPQDRVFFYAGFDQHLLTFPRSCNSPMAPASLFHNPPDYDYKDQQLVFSAAQHAEYHGGSVSHHHAGQCRVRKSGFHALSKTAGVRAPQHLALQRHQQRLLRSLQSDDQLRRKRQWIGERADREPGCIVDQRLDQQTRHQPACPVLPRLTSSPPPTPKIRGPKSTT